MFILFVFVLGILFEEYVLPGIKFFLGHIKKTSVPETLEARLKHMKVEVEELENKIKTS